MELTERAEVRNPTVNEPRVPEGWVLCEIGMDWSKTGDIMGAAWITKNSRGKVLEHSRRAFSGSKTVGEAKLQSVRNLEFSQSYVAAGSPPLVGPLLQQ
ncbi:hypothetical protein Bca101_002399 [Brassica carinata]